MTSISLKFGGQVFHGVLTDSSNFGVICLKIKVRREFFTPQPLRTVGVLFSPMVSGWAGWVGGWVFWREIVCPGCISETVRCRKLIFGRYIG